MRSENQHIDDFFREKEEEYVPGNGLQQMHWQQMSSMLVNPGQPKPISKTKIFTSRRIIKYLGGFSVVTVLTVILITTTRHKKPVAGKNIIPATQSRNFLPVKDVEQKTNAAIAEPITAAKTSPGKNSVPADSNTKHIVSRKVPDKKTFKPLPAQKIEAVVWRNEPTSKKDNSIEINNAHKPDAAALLRQFYSQLEQPKQVFSIRADRDTLLTARQGTRLYIPAHAFITGSGKTVTGTVKIILNEYYHFDDMVAAKLTTTTFNGQQLVSGGMVNIKAEYYDEEVQLQKKIKLNMPADKYDDRMELFTGNSVKEASALKVYNNEGTRTTDTTAVVSAGDIIWGQAGQRVSSYARPTILVKDMRNNPRTVNYGPNKTIAVFTINARSGLDKKAIKKELTKRYGYYYDKIIVRQRQKLNIVRKLIFIGPDVKPAIGDTVEVSFDEAIKYKLITARDSIQYLEKVRRDSIAFVSNMSKDSGYLFMITSLGWFNCDRFNNDPRPKIEFTITMEKEFDTREFIPQLLFTRYRSLIPGYYRDGKIHFGKIPENEPVQLVSIGVKEGKIMVCMQPVTVSAQATNELRFEEMTPQQFRNKLSSLNILSPNP